MPACALDYVAQGSEGEERIVFVQVDYLPSGKTGVEQVPMAQHSPFWISRRSGRVDVSSNIVRTYRIRNLIQRFIRYIACRPGMDHFIERPYSVFTFPYHGDDMP